VNDIRQAVSELLQSTALFAVVAVVVIGVVTWLKFLATHD
jgi:hypothetical protein